jgi:hypothetical protein
MKRVPISWLSVGIVVFLTASFSAQSQDRPGSEGSGPALAVGDQFQVLYRISGVTDAARVATAFHCSSLSSETETVSIVIRNFNGTVRANTSFSVEPSQTKTVTTRATNLYVEDVVLNTLAVTQGLALIRATSRDVICSAMIVDPAAIVPQGIALHMVRSNPQTGTQE